MDATDVETKAATETMTLTMALREAALVFRLLQYARTTALLIWQSPLNDEGEGLVRGVLRRIRPVLDDFLARAGEKVTPPTDEQLLAPLAGFMVSVGPEHEVPEAQV